MGGFYDISYNHSSFSLAPKPRQADHCSQNWCPSLEAMKKFFMKSPSITWPWSTFQQAAIIKKKFQLVLAVPRHTRAEWGRAILHRSAEGSTLSPLQSGKKQDYKADLHWGNRKKSGTEQSKVVSVSDKDRNRTQESSWLTVPARKAEWENEQLKTQLN